MKAARIPLLALLVAQPLSSWRARAAFTLGNAANSYSGGTSVTGGGTLVAGTLAASGSNSAIGTGCTHD